MRVNVNKTKLRNGKVVLVKDYSSNFPNLKSITNPSEVYLFARDFLELDKDTEEYIYMLCMNLKSKLICVFEVSHGTVDSSLISSREIFQKALLANAKMIVLIHNHPSGNSMPSNEDIDVTSKLLRAGNMIGIELADHIIIGSCNYYSLKDHGKI
jgi:DNA repair protein radC